MARRCVGICIRRHRAKSLLCRGGKVDPAECGGSLGAIGWGLTQARKYPRRQGRGGEGVDREGTFSAVPRARVQIDKPLCSPQDLDKCVQRVAAGRWVRWAEGTPPLPLIVESRPRKAIWLLDLAAAAAAVVGSRTDGNEGREPYMTIRTNEALITLAGRPSNSPPPPDASAIRHHSNSYTHGP